MLGVTKGDEERDGPMIRASEASPRRQGLGGMSQKLSGGLGQTSWCIGPL